MGGGVASRNAHVIDTSHQLENNNVWKHPKRFHIWAINGYIQMVLRELNGIWVIPLRRDLENGWLTGAYCSFWIYRFRFWFENNWKHSRRRDTNSKLPLPGHKNYMELPIYRILMFCLKTMGQNNTNLFGIESIFLHYTEMSGCESQLYDKNFLKFERCEISSTCIKINGSSSVKYNVYNSVSFFAVDHYNL